MHYENNNVHIYCQVEYLKSMKLFWLGTIKDSNFR